MLGFWATCCFAQAITFRLSEKTRMWDCVLGTSHRLGDQGFGRPHTDLLFNFAFCLTYRLGECLSVRRSVSSPRWGGTRLSEISQVNQFSMLAQARNLSLSERGLVAWVKASSPSEFSAVYVYYLYALMKHGSGDVVPWAGRFMDGG